MGFWSSVCSIGSSINISSAAVSLAAVSLASNQASSKPENFEETLQEVKEMNEYIEMKRRAFAEKKASGNKSFKQE